MPQTVQVFSIKFECNDGHWKKYIFKNDVAYTQTPPIPHVDNCRNAKSPPLSQMNDVICGFSLTLFIISNFFEQQGAVEKKFPSCLFFLANWTLSPYGIFFIIFSATTFNGRTKKMN